MIDPNIWYVVGPILYGIGIVISYMTLSDWYGEVEAHNVVFWPIALLKFLAICLYKVLFTGWDFK